MNATLLDQLVPTQNEHPSMVRVHDLTVGGHELRYKDKNYDGWFRIVGAQAKPPTSVWLMLEDGLTVIRDVTTLVRARPFKADA